MTNTQHIALTPSQVVLPEQPAPYPSILDFLTRRFPKIPRDIWEKRIEAGKVTDDRHRPITSSTPYRPNLRLLYYREVEEEPTIPFEERIIFRNEHLIVVCKPHFLPVTPSGPYVTECVLNRLKAATGIDDLVPVHRIDRETAGLVMFSANKATRAAYHELFRAGEIRKQYEALTTMPNEPDKREWLIESRIITGEPWFRMTQVDGPVNAVTRITLLEIVGDSARFHLEPLTGKQHQLRLHLMLLGCHILNDRVYPVLQPKTPDDFTRPLQLLAKHLSFIDPVTHQAMQFSATRTLNQIEKI